MTVERLIEILLSLPLDAQVFHLREEYGGGTYDIVTDEPKVAYHDKMVMIAGDDTILKNFIFSDFEVIS